MNVLASEYALTDAQFGWVIEQVKERTGINLSESKRGLVYNRLAGRLRSLGLDRFEEYLKLVESDDSEVEQFVNAITTNVTAFFREPHHFDFLRQEALPRIIRDNADSRRIRIWSAGCSKGMEPYSIAMVVAEVVPDLRRWDVKILATDLDTDVLRTGEEGVYEMSCAETISDARRKAFALKGSGSRRGYFLIRPELRALVHFRQLNLVKTWPVSKPFDIIFCRNVVIYFDRPTQQTLWKRFGSLLAPNGHLLVGHSESIVSMPGFVSVGRTIYRKAVGS